MRSSFHQQRRPIVSSSVPKIDENYDLRGLNLSYPDDVMPKGETPYTINSRMYARNDGETRVANRTRKGASFLSTDVGTAANVQNVATSTGDLDFSTIRVIANPYTPSSTGALSKLETEIKKAAGATGHIIVEVYDNNGGVPGTMIAQSSILSSIITTSFQYLTCRFIDAPTVVNGTQYWIVYYVQDNGSGTYYLNKTAGAGALDLLSTDGGDSWASLGCLVRYKSYLATSGGVKGWHLRYPSGGDNRIMIAQGDSIYSILKGTGVATSIDSGLNASASKVRFFQYDDKTGFVNGFNKARWWDGTTTTDVANVPSNGPLNAIVWQNRLFLQTEVTRYDFSELSDPETWPSVNFFYVPAPKSPDHVAGHIVFQDNLVIFTHETKHILIGASIGDFTRKEAVGTKGATSQEAICADRNYVYFMADDGNIYRWNGVSDENISDKMQPEFQGIQDLSKVRLSIYRNQLRVYYPKIPSAQNNRMALFDLELKEWFMDTDHPVAGSAELYLDDNELVEFSSVVGRVMYGETQYSDLGRMIDWKYYTRYFSYGSGSSKKRIKRFRPILRTAQADYTMLIGKDIDFQDTPDMREYMVSGGGAKWGAFIWGDGTKWGKRKQIRDPSAMSGRGNHIQYRFERAGVETPVELYGYISQYKVGAPK